MTNRSLLVPSILALALAAWSCEEPLLEIPVPRSAAEIGVTYENLPWRLVNAQIDGKFYDVAPMSRFRLVTAPGQYFGLDGCNWFSTDVTCEGDSIEFHGFLQTMMGCRRNTYLELCPLSGRWRVSAAPGLLTFQRGRSILQLRSDHSFPVKEFPLAGRSWDLVASTDSLFPIFETAHFLPRLSLTKDRRFEISSATRFGSLRTSGYYGVGERRGVNFDYYSDHGWVSTALPSTVWPAALSDHVLACDRVRVEGESAFLTDSKSGRTYTFRQVIP